MTRPARDANLRCPVFLLAALVAALVMFLGTGTASAATATAAQTRVGAHTLAAQVAVGPHSGIGAGQRLGNNPPAYDSALATGVAAETGLADQLIVVRGGVSEVPPASEVFSGSYGSTLDEAASGVPHNQIRQTTVGQIRSGGGTVEVAPEMTRSGVMNEQHVNICLGEGSCPFGPLEPNPIPKSGRIQ